MNIHSSFTRFSAAVIVLFCGVSQLLWAYTNGPFATFTERRTWVMQQAPTNADVKNFVLAEVQFARGEIAGGKTTALTASRLLLRDHLQKPSQQVQLFNIWPALDCYLRFGAHLENETRTNVQFVVTHFLGYSGNRTSNLKTLGHVVRYLGSEAFGEAAFATNAIWRSDDPNAYKSLLALIANNATNGFGEHASRPYYSKNLLPMLSLAQLAMNQTVRHRAMLAFQAGLSQNAGCWMRGHIGVSSGRSYPDQETQRPMGSMRLLWLYFGGDVPPDKLSDAAFASVMNYEPLPVIQRAAADRSFSFTSRGGYFGAQQVSFLDRDYVLFSEGPGYYGNFQIYPDGVMWCDTNDAHFSFLWLCAPWNDNPAVNSGSWPHGMNRAIYSEAQIRDSLLQIYNFDPADTNRPPYVLGYVPGGWLAAVNEAATSGKIFLHYGTVMIAISCEVPFRWNTNSGIYAPSQKPVRAGDSEFRIWGLPIRDSMRGVAKLANSYLGSWKNQFATAIDTTRPDLFSGATPAEQLAAFRGEVIARTGIGHEPGAPPAGCYTNRHGDTLRVKQTSELQPSPVLINGHPVDFAGWPLTENPWIHQSKGGSLKLTDGAQNIIYDFSNWTITTNFSSASTSSPASEGTVEVWQAGAANTNLAFESSLLAHGFLPAEQNKLPREWEKNSGAIALNAKWKTNSTLPWFIEYQKDGRDWVLAGLATGDRDKVGYGLKILEWGWARMEADGSFKHPDNYHSASFFIEATAHSISLLEASPWRVEFAPQLESFKPKLLAAARWMIRPDIDALNWPDDNNYPRIFGERRYAHRRFLDAAALGQVAVMFNDKPLMEKSIWLIRNGIALQHPDGVNPERGGHDTSYQALGLLYACRYYELVADEAVRAEMKPALEKGFAWLRTRIQPDGNIDGAGNTRTGPAAELGRNGKPKGLDYRTTGIVLAHWARLSGDVSCETIARRVFESSHQPNAVNIPKSSPQ